MFSVHFGYRQVHFGMSVNATSVRQLLRARIAATSAEFE